MTWKEFKEELEALGVKDEDEIAYIDTHPMASGYVKVDRGKNGIEVIDTIPI